MSSNEHIDDQPSDTDVLFGRDKVMFNHIGNIRFRLVIQSRAKEYETAPSRREKSAIVYSVVQKVHSYGGRFLRKEKNGKWRIVTVTEAIQKVGHALRDKKQHEQRLLKKGKQSKSVKRNCDMLFKLGEICSNEMKTMEDTHDEGSEDDEEAGRGHGCDDVKSESRTQATQPDEDTIMEDASDEPPQDVESEEESCAKTILQMHLASNETKKKSSEATEGHSQSKASEMTLVSQKGIPSVSEPSHVDSKTPSASSPRASRAADGTAATSMDARRPANMPSASVIAQARSSLAQAIETLHAVPGGLDAAHLSVSSLLQPPGLPAASRAAYFESMARAARQAALAYEQAEREERARLEAVNRQISQRAATLSLLAYRQQIQQQAAGRPNRNEEVDFQEAFKRREAFRSVTPPSEVTSKGDTIPPQAPPKPTPAASPEPNVSRPGSQGGTNRITEATPPPSAVGEGDKKNKPKQVGAGQPGSEGEDKNWVIYPLSFQDYGLASSGWKLALMPVRDNNSPALKVDGSMRFSPV